MKMKLREVNKNLNGLAGLGGKVFPSKLSFAVSCNIERLQREAERIEKERKKLCEQYSDKDKDGKPVMVDSIINGQKTQEYRMSDTNRKELGNEYDEFLNTEIEVEIRTVKQEVLERCEEMERYDIPSVADIVSMAFMIEE